MSRIKLDMILRSISKVSVSVFIMAILLSNIINNTKFIFEVCYVEFIHDLLWPPIS